MHKKGHWRSKRLEDWGITINDKSKSSTGYVGLKNLGCICYMNSFNQQLFMIPYFRYSITNADDATAGSIEPEDNVLYQVQKMFMNLEYSEKKYYNPRPFCNSFKDYEGNPTNVI
jgi:ubiquitin carboxyl-terminal hydrolase 9/24